MERVDDTVTVTLHLRPDVEAGLIAQAHANGMALEEYLLSLVLEFGERHRLSLGEPITRKLLHEGHRL